MGSAKCILLQSQRIQLLSELLLGPSALSPAQLPAPSCHSSGPCGHLGAIPMHTRGYTGTEPHSRRFLGRGDNSCFVQDLFSVSPVSAAFSPLFPLSTDYFKFPSQRVTKTKLPV